MSLRNRLAAFIEGLDVELNGDMKEDTPLIESGLFDSLALVQLAAWIEQQIEVQVDLTAFDLSKEWNTIADILSFIEKHRGRNCD
jgi:D-alanine--poly(phosphoribitol) ligase subunit 2